MNLIDQIWQKAKVVPTEDPNYIRLDSYGNFIKKESFNKYSPMGWTVEHIEKEKTLGIDYLDNIRPVNIKNL